MDFSSQGNCEFCRIRSLAVETLDKLELKILQNNCAGSIYNKGEIIFQQGSLTSNIGYVKSGLVKIHKSGPSRDQILKLAEGHHVPLAPQLTVGAYLMAL